MRKWSELGVSFLVIQVLLPLGFAQPGLHAPTPEESISIKNAGGPVISPDGKFVVYGVREADWEQNDYVSHLWLADIASGRVFQLTRGSKSSGSAEWSPDGRWVAFITEREAGANPEAPAKPEQTKKEDQKEEKAGPEGKPAAKQIWMISPLGGEAWELTKHEKDVGGFHWSKDGQHIAFTAAPPETKAAKDRKEKYSDYELFEKDFTQTQLWLVDVVAAEKSQTPVKAIALTIDGKLNVEDFRWSPDSSRIVFSATPNPLLAFSEQSDLYLLDLGPGVTHTVHKIVAIDGPQRNPVFSPDGKQIAFQTALAEQYDYYLNSHIATVQVDTVLAHPATTVADITDLTSKFDEDPDLIDWGPDGIYFAALQKTSGHVFRIYPSSHNIVRITAPDNYLAGHVSFTNDFKQMAISASDATHMTEIFFSATSPFAPRKLTALNAQLAGFTLGSEEVVSWKSQDGAAMEGVLHKPADYDPGKKYPLLVVIHGGPTGISLPVRDAADHYYPIQIFLAKGALVLEPNYRGSAGYGEKFRSLNVRNLGVGDMWDVMSGVDALIALGLVDPARLGAMGWSEGGYISAFLTTHTDRFKAISVGAGISDWMTYYVNTDITPFTRQYLHATPWDDPEIYAKTSPISTIKQARTPTLIQQGGNDKRVPVPDSYELYRGLQDQHVPSKLILYTGFGHGINKPKSNLAVTRANLDWFSHYIWGEPIPTDSSLLGSSEANDKVPDYKGQKRTQDP